MTNVDVLRVVCALLSVVLVVGMVVCAIELRGDRQFGCYGYGSCFAVFVCGSYQRLHEPPILTTWLTLIPIALAVVYLGRVHSSPHWRDRLT